MSEIIILPPPDPTGLPAGIYFRKAHIDDSRLSGEVKVRAFITTVVAGLTESREFIFTAVTILDAVLQMLAFLGALAVKNGVPLQSELTPQVVPAGLTFL